MSGAVMQKIDALLADPVAAFGAEGGIGFVGTDLPIEVLLACGRRFGHLPWQAAGATPQADRWLESSFPYWARSIVEQWLAGAFDALETVVFSRADDPSQRLYYYITELRRRGLIGGPVPYVFDVALVTRETSVAHTAAAIARLTRTLGADSDSLGRAIVRANRLRQTLAAIQRGRRADGPAYERLGRAALWSDPTRWLGDLGRGGSDEARATGMPSPETAQSARPRVLLAGSVPPDERLHAAVEAGGASVIAEAHVHRLLRHGPAVEIGADTPERALALQLQRASVGPRAFLDRAQWLVGQTRAAQADAVILWLTREDEALAWHVPPGRQALAAAGIPALVLPAARWAADDGTLERIAEFCNGGFDAAA